ncbi:Hsp70 family protein [Streptomyces coffeae]|uniref:Hsp70 family protein n=1 Tax=Streptomyces coffeae TaxID=621382 RepID=A0ABS1NB52_9ACTN|nr:Hsp70 family protein [Streptomyces coffeae]MBL1097302.1 Hsp70 family protein [Streptomyces coffeae]
MAKAVGIDLGTTNSVIAVWEGGEASAVTNAEGSRTTPSVVAFTDSGERLVGRPARRQAILDPKGTLSSAKRFIGRMYDEIPDEVRAVAYDVVEGEGGVARSTVGDTALAYGMDKKEHETVLVFDLGGGTFDVSILDVGDGVVEVRSTAGDGHLGGDDVDRTQVNLPFITADASGPKHLTQSVMRSTFDQLTADLVERCLGPVEQAMADAKVSENDIDEVILVGGSTRIPAVQALVRRLTGGKEPHTSVNPDEVVALGAAIQAGVLKGEVKDVLLLDVTPLSLGVETRRGVMTKIIERNTTIPVRRTETFSTAEDHQPAVDVVVLQGERERAADNRVLGRFQLTDIRPAPRGEPQIEVIFDIDANGILHVTARDRDTGKEQSIQITESSNLDRSEVERMVSEAERNRGEDQALREAVDVRNELDATAYQVEKRLTELGASAPSHEKARAELLVSEARQAVKDEAGIDRTRPLISELQQIHAGLASHVAAAAGGAAGGAGTAGARDTGPGTAGAGDDDIIDAEFDKG